MNENSITPEAYLDNLINNFFDNINKEINKKKKFNEIHKDNFNSIFTKKCKKYGFTNQNHILKPVRRILVIGDIHGDFDMLVKTLKIGKVIDDNNNWSGGDTVIVQVGDQIDRCRYDFIKHIPCEQPEATQPDEGHDVKILKYLTNLHMQAIKDNGAVYSLLGNHELMNVDQDMRYVSYEGFKEFDNYEIDKDYDMSKNIYDIEIKDNKITDGHIARRWAFSKGNPLAEFLACTRQVAIIIGSNLFVHAGILPKIAKKYSIKTINEIMSLYLLNTLKTKKEYNEIFKHYEKSPLWNRVFGNMARYKIKYNSHETINENQEIDYFEDDLEDIEPHILECRKLLKPIETIYKVDKIYIGHTPFLQNGITNICDKKIWLTDYGMSTAFDQLDDNKRSQMRQAQILEILDDGKIINILK